MKRFAFTLLLAVCFAGPVPRGTNAEDVKSPEKVDEVEALNKYMSENLPRLATLINSDPDAAEKQLDSMRRHIDSLKPETEQAKQLTERAKSVLTRVEQQLALVRISLDEIAAKLKANPDDEQAIENYLGKVAQELVPLTRAEPEQAEQKLMKAREFLLSVSAKAEKQATRQAIQRGNQLFANLEESIESGKKLASLIGKEAAPLEVEAWVNGSPLSEQDLKGKVVLLDFWAVWCGPCIATFPHLREWQEKYADKGLVIVGLTRYFNFAWDEEAGRAAPQPNVSHEQEQEMLEKFAEHHNLHHRFAIQKDDKLTEYYGVSGIPHVVVIDRHGKIRLMRVGSGDQNARDVDEMLKKLVDE